MKALLALGGALAAALACPADTMPDTRRNVTCGSGGSFEVNGKRGEGE